VRRISDVVAVRTALSPSGTSRWIEQLSLLFADAKDFSTFFAKQVSIWGQVVRENNIKA